MHRHLLALIACGIALCSPLASMAEVYKCKQADGTITYTERPCTGAAVRQVAPWADHDPLTPAEAERKDKAMQQFLKDADAAFQAEARKCRAGHMRACQVAACGAAQTPAGTMNDLALCARSHGRPHGRNWALIGGTPEFMRPQAELRASAARLPPGVFWSGERLTLACWGAASARPFPGYATHPVTEHKIIRKGDALPSFEFLPYQASTPDEKMPHYRTLEALAEEVCR